MQIESTFSLPAIRSCSTWSGRSATKAASASCHGRARYQR
jgi:hypothetical protein